MVKSRATIGTLRNIPKATAASGWNMKKIKKATNAKKSMQPER